VSLADVRFTGGGAALVAELTGEIDLSNADAIAAAISESVSKEREVVVLDLSRVDYLDSAGIQLIYRLRTTLESRRQRLRLVVPPSSTAHDVLRFAGIADRFELLAGREQALEM
jgi:anti-sigma B factor antagonist